MLYFVINLARSPDRLAYMQAQADKLGLDLERIDAVDGARVPEWLEKEFVGTPLLPGEIGCYASHLVAAKAIVDRSLPFAIVSEDDVPLADDFKDVVRSAIAAAPPGWDFIHLTEYNLRTLVGVADLHNGHRLVRYTRLPKNTVAYAISNAGAKKWLKPTARVRPSDVDVRYAWLFNLNIIGVYPPVATRTAGFVSDIDKTSAARGRPSKRNWAPSPLSRLYGGFWQVYKLGIRNSVVGQSLNFVNWLREHHGTKHPVPII